MQTANCKHQEATAKKPGNPGYLITFDENMKIVKVQNIRGRGNGGDSGGYGGRVIKVTDGGPGGCGKGKK